MLPPLLSACLCLFAIVLAEDKPNLPGVELLSDDTIVTRTYIKYPASPEPNSVVCVPFKLSEADALLKR